MPPQTGTAVGSAAAAVTSTKISREEFAPLSDYHVQVFFFVQALLGWLFALIGLNIQHDANHGAVSRYGIVNLTSWILMLLRLNPLHPMVHPTQLYQYVYVFVLLFMFGDAAEHACMHA